MTRGLANSAQTPLSFRERLTLEGQPYGVTGTTEGATWTTDGSVAVTLSSPGITRAWAIDHVIISCNKNARAQLWLNDTGLGGATSHIESFIVTPGAPVVIPVSTIQRPALQAASNGAQATVKLRNVYDTDKTNTNLVCGAIGYAIADDLDLAAPKAMLWLGDSITGYGTGPTVKSNQYDWRVRNYLRSKGIRVRMVNMSASGTTSVFHESRRLQGAYDLPQDPDYLFYSLGVNDAVQGTTAATYKANVAAAIAWKKALYPKAKMVVIGATPIENTTNETALATLRTNAAAAVTEAADATVKYVSLATAFDRTLTSNYAASDTTGNHIHPNDTGHAAIWAVLQPWIDANL